MFIEEECEGSDDEDGDGGYHSDTDGNIDVAGADGGYVDDGRIFVSEGDANATDPTHSVRGTANRQPSISEMKNSGGSKTAHKHNHQHNLLTIWQGGFNGLGYENLESYEAQE